MARPLRYEASGAIYHIMARGEGWKDVFLKGVGTRISTNCLPGILEN